MCGDLDQLTVRYVRQAPWQKIHLGRGAAVAKQREHDMMLLHDVSAYKECMHALVM